MRGAAGPHRPAQVGQMFMFNSVPAQQAEQAVEEVGRPVPLAAVGQHRELGQVPVELAAPARRTTSSTGSGSQF